MEIYLFKDGQQVGPFSVEDILRMMASNEISDAEMAWHEGLTGWQPLSTIVSLLSRSGAPPVPVRGQAGQNVVQTNVKQGAIIGGFVCFLLGVAVMYASLLSFFFYGPLFLVAFILSIVAMSQRRVFSGVVLLLATLVVPAVLGLVLFAHRTVDFAKKIEAKTTIASSNQSVPIAHQENAASNESPTTITGASAKPAESPATQPVSTPIQPKYPKLEEKNGFRNFRLGAQFSEFADVRLTETRSYSEGEKHYRVEDIDKKIGSAELDGVILVFSQGLLKEIELGVSGDQNREGLREALIAAYGQPETKEEFVYGNVLVWEGPTVKLVLQSRPRDIAVFTNKNVSAKIDLLIKQKAKAGASEGAKNL